MFTSSLLVTCFVVAVTLPFAQSQENLYQLFITWSHNFKIRFSNEEEHRFNLFAKWIDNHRFIESFNKEQNRSFVLGHNQFSAMDSADFRKYLNPVWNTKEQVDGYINRIDSVAKTSFLRGATVSISPSEVDWVAKGGVTHVKDQGQCGSCWSFSTTGALEGAYFVKNNVLFSFSEQQLVDCDNLKNGGRDHGCNGGLMDNAFQWIDKNGGLCSEGSYPYVSGTTLSAGACEKTCPLIDGSKILSFVDVKPNSDQDMMAALVKQPVSVAIEADQREFQLYKSGVFTASCGTNLDHGVLVVGYGTDKDTGLDYYKVKNSWSETWGAGGYIYLGRGSNYNNGAGQCGVLMEASYPVL